MRKRQRKLAKRIRSHHRKQLSFFVAFKKYLTGFAPY